MTISASEQVQTWLSGLRPDAKRRIRAALKSLQNPRPELDVKALRSELEGFYRLRVGDYRIVYHFEKSRTIRLDYADLRDEVYEAFKRLRALRATGENPEI